MSAITIYKEPQDILFKLLREGRRAWYAEVDQDKCDHFYNFCVTAHSLRDWCIKYLGLSGSALNDFHTEMNTIKYFAECRDIANSSKHFGLDNKTSLVSSASTIESEFAAITGMENGECYQKVNRKDIAITLSDGTCKDLFGFLHFVASNWIGVMKNKRVPINSGYHPIYIFYPQS